ncbi:MAG: hypothetical protein NWQ40_05820, partial [Schleiferiaceae bacterium]|nr:hypothetical protein [Schleiferiaceae bacterium]
MTKTILSLLLSFVISSLTAQTFYNEYYNATFNISEGTGSFKVNGLFFEGELLSKDQKVSGLNPDGVTKRPKPAA